MRNSGEHRTITNYCDNVTAAIQSSDVRSADAIRTLDFCRDFEHLTGRDAYSIRLGGTARLIFRWVNSVVFVIGVAVNHEYEAILRRNADLNQCRRYLAYIRENNNHNNNHRGRELQAVDDQRDRLTSGERLNRQCSLLSPNQVFKLAYQEDGNLVIYEGDDPIWATSTDKQSTSHRDPGFCEMQRDGNFQMTCARGNKFLESRTRGEGAYIIMQNDGNLVIYLNGKPLWCSRDNRLEFNKGRQESCILL
jgi:plasmid maintenance system killer protein